MNFIRFLLLRCSYLGRTDLAEFDIFRSEQRQALAQGLDGGVGSSLQELLDGVLAGRHADHSDAGAVAGLDVARGVAAGEAVRPAESLAADQLGPLERLLRQLGSVPRVRA